MRRACRVLGALALAVGAFLLLAWTGGLILSDRWIWSQFLSWIPSIVLVPVAAALWLLAAALRSLGRIDRTWPRRNLWIVGLWLCFAAGYLLIVDLRLYRLPLPPRPTTPHLRILHWNVSAIERLAQITEPMLAQNPDVAVLVNPHSSVGWGDFPAAVAQFKVLNVGGFVVVSRVPVLTYGMVWLGIEGLPPETQSTLPRRRGWSDPGRAMFVELDTTESLGKTTILWMLDLPSEPRLSRWTMATDAAKTIREWPGPIIEVTNQDTGGRVASARAVHGFPPPDIAVGDFNIPRGGASLSMLFPGMRNAYGEAGAGYSATWPRTGFKTPIPMYHIDQMFVGASLKAARYEIVDPGFGYHMFQVGDVVVKQ